MRCLGVRSGVRRTLTFLALHLWHPLRVFVWFSRGIVSQMGLWDMQSDVHGIESEGRFGLGFG